MARTSRKKQNQRRRRSDSRQAQDQKPASQNQDEKSTKTYPMVLAGPIKRLYAFTIDLGIIMMAIYTIAPISGGRLFSDESAIPNILFIFGYFVLPTTIWGRTAGKWVAGVVVVDPEGRTPGPAAIPREMIGKFVSFVSFGIGLIWLVFDSNSQAWHDKIAGTYVVENPDSGGPQFMRDFFKLGSKTYGDGSDSKKKEDSSSD
jgi:uncharacterized RDD family membrane protein YckC